MSKLDFTSAISGYLNEYGKEIREEVEELADEVAGETLKEIKANSPVGKGSYKKGWRKKTKVSALGKKTITVYNATDYQLTHLLENGHLNRDGTTLAAPIKHIKPAEKKAVEKFEKGVEEIIKNAGRNL